MRITNGMMMKSYQRNLNKSLGSLNYYSNRTTTLRKFNTASEDPVRAAKAYSLRRSYYANDDHLSNVEDVDNMMTTAQGAMLNLQKIISEASSSDVMQAINGTMSQEDREIVATKLQKTQEALVAAMNTKYGDRFLFGGAENSQPPFTISTDGKGVLLYRGIDVTTGKQYETFEGTSATAYLEGADIDFGKGNGDLLNGYTINVVKPDPLAAPPITDGMGSINSNTKVINLYVDEPITAAAMTASLTDAFDPANTKNVGTMPTHSDGTGLDASKVSIKNLPIRYGTGEINGGTEPIYGGSTINFGGGNNGILEGYKFNIVDKDSTTPAKPNNSGDIDNTTKTINLYVTKPTPPAMLDKADITAALATIPAYKAPTGTPPVPDANANSNWPANDKGFPFDATKISIDHNLTGLGSFTIKDNSAKVSDGTQFDMTALSKETDYVDIGLGLSFVNGKLNEQSAFNVALPGIDFLGFGTDEKGNPNNLYTLIGKITEQLKKTDGEFSIDTTQPLLDSYNKQAQHFLTKITDFGSSTNFMDYAKTRLEDTAFNLNAKMKTTEMVEPDEAITDWKMQQFAYMAALQIGAKILQPSFLDYMR